MDFGISLRKNARRRKMSRWRKLKILFHQRLRSIKTRMFPLSEPHGSMLRSSSGWPMEWVISWAAPDGEVFESSVEGYDPDVMAIEARRKGVNMARRKGIRPESARGFTITPVVPHATEGRTAA